jgi:hypothetical protein
MGLNYCHVVGVLVWLIATKLQIQCSRDPSNGLQVDSFSLKRTRPKPLLPSSRSRLNIENPLKFITALSTLEVSHVSVITMMSARRLETVPESSSILFTSDLDLDRNREGTELHDFGGPICCKHVADFLHSSFIGILIKLDRCTLLLFTLTIRFEIMVEIALDSLGYLVYHFPLSYC